jgi:hypothetical protein
LIVPPAAVRWIARSPLNRSAPLQSAPVAVGVDVPPAAGETVDASAATATTNSAANARLVLLVI